MTRVFTWKTPAAAAVAALLAAVMLWPSGANADHLAEAGLELPGLVEVTSGWMHSCGRGAAGEVYCWGNNATGNLGDGTAANARPVAKRVTGFDAPVRQVSAGADHTCALTEVGDIWCWGGNLAGQLGGLGADTAVVRRNPGKLTLDAWGRRLPAFTQLSAGNSHSCALDTTGTPWCWGGNSAGQLGDGCYGCAFTSGGGAPRPVNVQRMGAVRKVLAGATHSCAVTPQDALWCWGDNGYGQLGVDSTTDLRAPEQVHATGGFPDGGVADFALGTEHTCAVTRNTNVYCWGDNTHGRLGTPSATSSPTAQGPDSLVPVRVKRYDNSPTHHNGVFTGMVGVSAGLDHTCAWSADGVGWCWGRAAYGHLGDGIVSTSQPRPRYAVVDRALTMQLTGPIRAIAAGYNHTCSLNEGGKAHCWGHNGFGQNGDGTFVFNYRPSRVLQIDAPV